MRMLAFALEQQEEADQAARERRLVLLRTLFEKDGLDRDDTFDLGSLLTNEREYGEGAAVYEKSTREHHSGVAYFNLALSYPGPWSATRCPRRPVGRRSQRLCL